MVKGFAACFLVSSDVIFMDYYFKDFLLKNNDSGNATEVALCHLLKLSFVVLHV